LLFKSAIFLCKAPWTHLNSSGNITAHSSWTKSNYSCYVLLREMVSDPITIKRTKKRNRFILYSPHAGMA
uniref:Uncharacterized protein n=1 Tax=Anopheles minimus TaxID=112268 RepID=A0A182WPJ7_9DIPT